jgi:glycosyltransferase involved in cell wall biosynthesis
LHDKNVNEKGSVLMDVSVIIPTYNRANLLYKSIKSVLDQTVSPKEIIIVDDFSTDNTQEVVESFHSDRLKYIRNARLKGANGARNTGILMAKGNYIAFQDSDDLWLPTKLEKQLQYMVENPEVDMCFCSLNLINNSRGFVPNRKIEPEEMHHLLGRGNFISTQTIFMKKEVAGNNLFDENLKRYQDWDFCLRVSKKYLVHHLDEVLVNVEIQTDSISSKVSEIEALKQFFKKYPELKESHLINKSLYNKVLYYSDSQKGIRFNSTKHYSKYLFYKVVDKVFNERDRV